MFNIWFFLLITGFFTFIQIEFWMMFPRKLRNILVANPVLAFLITLCSGFVISIFTGIASFVGMANVCADIGFTIWVLIYKNKYGIKGLAIDWFRMFKVIPIFPKLVVQYEKNGKKWVE